MSSCRLADEASSQHSPQPVSSLTIDKIMSLDVLTVRPDSTLRETARIMLEHKIGGLPVMEGGQLVGITTESENFRVLIQDLPPLDWA